MIARDNGICHLCGLAGANSADHVIPHSKGGSDVMANLRAAHKACNEKKNGSMMKPVPKASRFDVCAECGAVRGHYVRCSQVF